MSIPVPPALGFSPEHDLTRREARRFLAERCPMRAVRDRSETPSRLDHGLWTEMAQLGWLGLTAPTELGGAGLDALHLALLCEEMGRALLPSPYLASTLALQAILRAGSPEQANRWARPIIAGETIATIALSEPGGGPDPEDIGLTATPDAGGWVLRGDKTHVLFGASAGSIVVPARDPAGALGLFVLDLPTSGASITDEVVVDSTRPAARLSLDGAKVPATGKLEGDGLSALHGTLVLGYTMIAAEMVGAAEAVLSRTRDYAVERRQFDRPIGAFQAVKHPLVDMMIGVEQARSLALAAAATLSHARDDAEAAARMAKALASEVLTRAVKKGVQLHGGYGFTWDCDVHFYFKRALWSRATLGDPAHHRQRLAAAMLG
jgi:alkylation response protein AidB-like acyl-CoA dehydrogenase